jgi:hypothetical protein
MGLSGGRRPRAKLPPDHMAGLFKHVWLACYYWPFRALSFAIACL